MDWKTGMLLNPTMRIDKAYEVKTDITQPTNLQLSHNNKYLSFINERGLMVIDLYHNESVFDSSVSLHPSSKILNYRWLPDRNSLLFINSEQHNSVTRLYSLDLNKRTNDEYHPHLDREFNFSMNEIINIEISTYTNNLYVLFKDTKQNTRLIKMDIMKAVNWLNLPQEKIHNIAVSNRFGNLFIESRLDGFTQIISLRGQERRIISNHPDDILLGCNDHTVYIGRGNHGYLQELFLYDYSAEDHHPTHVWQGTIPYNRGQVFITSDKQLLIKHDQHLSVFLQDGTERRTSLPFQSIVFSSTGNTYLEIEPREQGFNYYWRAIYND